MKYTRGTIDVATHNGKVTIPALIAGNTGLAYHKELEQDLLLGDTFVVSHVHTGLALLHVAKASDAHLALDELVSNSKGLIDWAVKDPIHDLSMQDYRAVRDMIRDIQQS